MANSYVSAVGSGIVANGTDMTSLINTLLASSSYSGIIFDFPPGSEVTINFNVTANGKVMQFQSGTILIGGGSITNAQIDAGYNQQCFDISIDLIDCKTCSNMFSVCWYGAGVNPQNGDSQPALQKSSDTVIANDTMGRTLYLPPMIYNIDRPWRLERRVEYPYNPLYPNYPDGRIVFEQWTLNIYGDYNIQSSSLAGVARIITNFAEEEDAFAIGVQRAYCGSISGISVEGAFNGAAGTVSFEEMITQTFDQVFPNNIRRDNSYSPSAGIVIDPFTDIRLMGGSVNLYPGLESFYERVYEDNGGTTGFKISDCYVGGFTVNICNTPNPRTQQGENCIIESCVLEYAKVAIAYGQNQSENCIVNNIRTWNSTWTVIDGVSYGRKSGVVAHISNLNVVLTKELFNINQNETFLIEKVYSESIFRIGVIQCGVTCGAVIGCTFHLNYSTPIQPEFHLETTNIELRDSNITYNNDKYDLRIRLKGIRTKFSNVFFDQPPYQVTWPSGIQNWGFIFEDCKIRNTILGMGNTTYNIRTAQSTMIAYGNFKLKHAPNLVSLDSNPNPKEISLTLEYNCSDFNRVAPRFATNINITPDSNRRAQFTSTNSNIARVNDILIENSSKKVVGRISSINGNLITISEIPININTLSNVILHLVYYVTIANPIVGDIEEGLAEIKNVSFVANYGYINNLVPGFRFDNLSFPLGTYVISFNSSNNTIIMSSPATKTATRQNFLNGNPKVEVSCKLPPLDTNLATFSYAFPGGTIWNEIITEYSTSPCVPVKWIFLKGGYLNAATLGLSIDYQSEFNIDRLIRVNGGFVQYYDPYTDSWINI